MKKWFYYFRDDDNMPLVTVCIIKTEEGQIARGISICSPNDNFSKKDFEEQTGNIVIGGRTIAYNRANGAIMNGFDSCPIIRYEGHQVLDKCGFDLETDCKSELNPILSDFENSLVYGGGRFEKDVNHLRTLINDSDDFEFYKKYNSEHGYAYLVVGCRKENELTFKVSYYGSNKKIIGKKHEDC